jgi:hypothetical protein
MELLERREFRDWQVQMELLERREYKVFKV